MTSKLAGGCLCGAVKYTCTAEPIMAGHCHCEDCRRSSGTGHCSHFMAPEEAVSISGVVRGYARPADSGALVERFFCPTCGAAVYSKNASMKGVLALRASSLDDLEAFKPQMHVYVARAASWDVRDPALPSFDTMPPGMGGAP